MVPHVLLEGAVVHCAVGAVRAGERLLAAVDPDVFLEIADVRAAITALWALVWPLASVCPDVVLEVLPTLSHVPTHMAYVLTT